MMTFGQLAWLILCLLAAIVSLVIAIVLKETGVSEVPGTTHPLLSMLCFFGLGGLFGLFIGGSDK